MGFYFHALTPEEAGYHEAGHAVVAYLRGRQILSIQINEMFDGGGAVEYEEWFTHYGLSSDDVPPPAAVEDEVCIHLGSFIVEGLRQGERRPLRHFRQDHQYSADRAAVNEWLTGLAGEYDGEDSLYAITAHRLLDATYASLSQPAHWLAVKAIAASIAARRNLSGDEATKIIREVIAASR